LQPFEYIPLNVNLVHTFIGMSFDIHRLILYVIVENIWYRYEFRVSTYHLIFLLCSP
jgi:hypothetical protein